MSKYLLDTQETKRLQFRRLAAADFDAWLPFYHNPNATKYWNGLSTDPIIACKEQFERQFERYEKGHGGMNALVSKQTGKLIGICGLLTQLVDDKIELEIGYSILPEYWLKGYAFEAASKCKTFAFDHELTESLISIIHVDNLPSQKVALKNGMHLDNTTNYKENPVHIFRVAAPKSNP